MFGLGMLIPNIVLLETVTPTQAGVTITPAYIVESPTILNPLSVALVASITTALPSMPLASMTKAPLQLRIIDLFNNFAEEQGYTENPGFMAKLQVSDEKFVNHIKEKSEAKALVSIIKKKKLLQEEE